MSGTATWDHPHGRSRPIQVNLAGRALLDPWRVEADLARPLQHRPGPADRRPGTSS